MVKAFLLLIALVGLLLVSNGNAAVVPGKFCPVCNMNGLTTNVFEFNGNQALYACEMGHEVDIGQDPTLYFAKVGEGTTSETRRDSADGINMTCPVCGMPVDENSPHVEAKYGQKLYACSLEHANQLNTEPLSFAPAPPSTTTAETPTTPPPTGPVPGKQCPVCNMDGQHENVFGFQGNQALYACVMGHEVDIGQDPTKYWTGISQSTDPSCTGANRRRDSIDEEDMTCPVCKMPVDSCSPYVEANYGQKVYACSHNHANAVLNDPLLYAEESSGTPGSGSDSDPLCYGGSVMLNGFQFSSQTCVLLWFEGWELNSEVKLAFAHIGVFFMGIVIECLGYFRRRITQKQNSEKRELTILEIIVNGLLFTLSICLGYFLMLVSMTYHAGLFICILLGLLAGNILFTIITQRDMRKTGKFSQKMAGMDDPCCGGGELDSDEDHETSCHSDDKSKLSCHEMKPKTSCCDDKTQTIC